MPVPFVFNYNSDEDVGNYHTDIILIKKKFLSNTVYIHD